MEILRGGGGREKGGRGGGVSRGGKIIKVGNGWIRVLVWIRVLISSIILV